MRLRSFLSAVSAAFDAFRRTMSAGNDPVVYTTPADLPPEAQLCNDEAVLSDAEEVLFQLSLHPFMTDRDRLLIAASKLGVKLVPQNWYYGLDINIDEFPLVIRWVTDPFVGAEVVLFIPRRNSDSLSPDFWAHNAKVALKNGATAERATTLLRGLAAQVKRGQVPATD